MACSVAVKLTEHLKTVVSAFGFLPALFLLSVISRAIKSVIKSAERRIENGEGDSGAIPTQARLARVMCCKFNLVQHFTYLNFFYGAYLSNIQQDVNLSMY